MKIFTELEQLAIFKTSGRETGYPRNFMARESIALHQTSIEAYIFIFAQFIEDSLRKDICADGVVGWETEWDLPRQKFVKFLVFFSK
jgi:hypothetical protein